MGGNVNLPRSLSVMLTFYISLKRIFLQNTMPFFFFCPFLAVGFEGGGRRVDHRHRHKTKWAKGKEDTVKKE